MRRLSAFAAAIALLHAVGWGLFAWYSRQAPALAGLGTVAYGFGLRHAFDADHIAAIDNTTRKLLRDGKRPLGTGFFFSLGHSATVFALVTALAIATGAVNAHLSGLQRYGSTIGASVSGTFLLVIGLVNLLVLADIVRAFRQTKRGRALDDRLERRLLDRGLASRVLLRRLGDRIDASWKMLPLGALFGLGFDTATEIALLALAAGAATHRLPFLAILALPTLFAAGMSLVDSLEGALMSRAYGWASAKPARRVSYDIAVTSVSVAAAFAIGLMELAQASLGHLHGLG